MILTAEYLKERDIYHIILDDGRIHINDSLDLCDTPITSLPERLSVGVSLFLCDSGVRSLPVGLDVGGWLDLNGTDIKSLPQDTSVGGWLLFNGEIVIQGNHHVMRLVGDTPIIMGRFDKFGDVWVAKCYYARNFGPDKPVCRKDNLVYMANYGEFYAHGETIEEAIANLTDAGYEEKHMSNSHWITFEEMEEGVVYIARNTTDGSVRREKFRQLNNQLQSSHEEHCWVGVKLMTSNLRFTPDYIPPEPKPVWEDDLDDAGDAFEWQIISLSASFGTKWSLSSAAAKDMDDEILARFLEWRKHLREEK